MVRRRRLRLGEGVEINMAPLIDMVFILLIFFLVTTSFVKEAGVEVERPTAATARPKRGNVMVGVTAEGRIFIERREVDIRSIRPLMERYLAENPEVAVVVVADRRTPTGLLIQVLDQCRLAGVKDVSIAAMKPKGG
ncbi:MAG TPA: biopolymer transporter ExbD [Deltaproteobacteria bacterium]|nr:biopolymer transporter ExbD [Deltaproteobacteria bacterium]